MSVADESVEPASLSLEHRAAKRRELVVPPPRVGVLQRPFGDFDQPFLDEALEQHVQRAGAQPDQAVGGLVDVEDDAVAVQWPVSQREQHVERERRQRQKRAGIAGGRHD